MNPNSAIELIGAGIGAVAGVLAAFLAVALQRKAERDDRRTTIEGLVKSLRSAADRLQEECASRPLEAARELNRAFSALEDTAAGMRTVGPAIATIASRMNHTSVSDEVRRLDAANGGISILDAKSVARDVRSLCDEIIEYFEIYGDQ